MSTLLIEIGCEELPYKVCESVIRQLEGAREAPGLVHKLLEAERLLESDAPDLRVLVSPRRIAVLVEGVPARQTAKTDDYRGPKATIAYDAERRRSPRPGWGSRARAAPSPRTSAARWSTAPSSPWSASRPSVATRSTCCRVSSRRWSPGCRSRAACAGAAVPAGEADYLRFSRPIRWLVCQARRHDDGERRSTA